ncbi:sensor histidine kinase [Vagococcus silagei]|uniref:histidine kinase n=1 Tax=Vagococcus silagei TaxID=2508885 RepID=A0A4V3TUX8_9ENTE|nr:sensor histidine kinase [Vagococcus silagei]THB60719.1 HAMP domain-containing histidine kinase [Vagococcus silagei]
MKTESKICFVWRYLKDQKMLYILFILIWFVLFLTIYLYKLPIALLMDACLFTSTILVGWSFYDGIKLYHEHQKLLFLLHQKSYYFDQVSQLPQPGKLLVQDYQQLFLEAVADKEKMRTELTQQNQYLFDYYSMWTHQIKTPLAALDLLVQNQSETQLTTQMKNEIFKVDDYLGMMLHYLKLNHVETDFVITRVNLGEVVKSVIRKYATFFIQKNLSVKIEPFEKEVITDEKWLTFMLEQIIFNSIKYTQKGGVSVRLVGERLSIEDTGIGILAQDLPRIFEKGYTGFNGREDKKATGLGLHLCQEIGCKLDLSLTAFSEVGKGTKIQIDFSQTKYRDE